MNVTFFLWYHYNAVNAKHPDSLLWEELSETAALFSAVSTVDTRERMDCKEVVTHGLQEKRRWPEEVIAERNKLAWEVQSAWFAWLAI